MLAGIDAAPTCRYQLESFEKSDAHTWSVCLRDAAQQGLDPDHRVLKQLLTGQAHAHWLELLGFQRLAIA